MSSITVSAPTPSGPSPEEAPEAGRARLLSELLRDIMGGGVVRTLLAVLLAFVVGSLLIIFTNDRVLDTLAYVTNRPGDFFSAAFRAAGDGYAALFRGAIYNTNASDVLTGLRPLTETLRFAGPLIAAGLGIALSFRVGLFNIGGQGQLVVGAAAAAYASFQWHLPYGLHLVVAVLMGLLASAIWAGIVGLLKARTGAHEVIVTIMMNYIAVFLVTFLMRTPVLNPDATTSNPGTKAPDATAQLPLLLGPGYLLHLGFILSLIAVIVFWWLMERSTIGFRFRAVGLNPDAALTAGIDVKRVYVLAMVFSGLFVGLAGVNQALGRTGGFGPSVDSGIGFDAITVALLGGSSAWGVLLAGIFFGAMRAGGPAMQSADVAPEILGVVQGLIVLFVAAPPLIRAIFRLPKGRGSAVNPGLTPSAAATDSVAEEAAVVVTGTGEPVPDDEAVTGGGDTSRRSGKEEDR